VDKRRKRRTTGGKKWFVFSMVDGESVAASSWQSVSWKGEAEFKITSDIFRSNVCILNPVRWGFQITTGGHVIKVLREFVKCDRSTRSSLPSQISISGHFYQYHHRSKSLFVTDARQGHSKSFTTPESC
jgi:hypothetical protein